MEIFLRFHEGACELFDVIVGWHWMFKFKGTGLGRICLKQSDGDAARNVFFEGQMLMVGEQVSESSGCF